MKVNELRIGNLIRWISTGDIEEVKEIETIKRKNGNINNVSIYDCVGIELSEEWMVKFGFEVGTDLFQDFKEYEKLFDIGKSITLSHEFECYNGIYSQKLNYVHQLQNLYFALTGVELQQTAP